MTLPIDTVDGHSLGNESASFITPKEEQGNTLISFPGSAEQYTGFVVIPQYWFMIPPNFLNTVVPQ